MCPPVCRVGDVTHAAPHELVQYGHDELAPPEVQLKRQASRQAGKRAVTIEEHADQPFGIAYGYAQGTGPGGSSACVLLLHC